MTTTTVTGFHSSHSELKCDDVSLSAIAGAEGTPLYVYSAADIRARYIALDDAFSTYPHRVHYAFKANSTLAITRLLRDCGAGADVNSVWELEVALRAGFPAADIVFTGVGKSPRELERAVPLGLKAINIESAGELSRVEAIAAREGTRARVAIRINPDIDAQSHPHISTGLRVNKFGVPADLARELAASIARRSTLQLVAVHVHVGSQITRVDPLARAAAFVGEFVESLPSAVGRLEYVDLGGGMGIPYDRKKAVTPEEYAAALLDPIRRTGLPIVIEPGRSLAGPAGVLLGRVIDIKPRTASSEFVVIDAGMTELMRPALYGAFHLIEPVTPRRGSTRHYEIVGPVCESSDVVGRDRELPPLEVGDLLAVRDAGAYGSAMASNYNRRPFPVEVLVEKGRWTVIRRRQTVEDMLSLES